jgi:hypothetical protein
MTNSFLLDTTSIQMPLSIKFTQNTALYQPMYKTYDRHGVAGDTVSGR